MVQLKPHDTSARGIEVLRIHELDNGQSKMLVHLESDKNGYISENTG